MPVFTDPPLGATLTGQGMLSAQDRARVLDVAERYERGGFHCPCGAPLTQEHPRCWVVADSLAQRILAALELQRIREENVGLEDTAETLHTLAAELRAALPQEKP